MLRFNLKALFGLVLVAAALTSGLSRRIRSEHEAARFFATRSATVTIAQTLCFGRKCAERVVAVNINDTEERTTVENLPRTGQNACLQGPITRKDRSVRIHESDFAMLAEMPSLVKLMIRSKHLPGRGMKDIAALRQLRVLRLVTPSVHDGHATHISHLTELRSLELDCELSDSGLASALSSMSKLRFVKLRGRVGSKTIRSLSTLALLEDVDIVSDSVSADDILMLRGSGSLKRVEVFGIWGDWVRVARAIAGANPSAVVSVRGVFRPNTDVRPADATWLTVDAVIRDIARYEPGEEKVAGIVLRSRCSDCEPWYMRGDVIDNGFGTWIRDANK